MSTYDPNNRPNPRSANSGGGWIIGIIIVVLIALGIWWSTGTTGPRTADTNSPPTATTGSVPGSTSTAPARPAPAAPGGASK